MQNKFVLGIDTSNYTTSVSVISLDGEVLLNSKELLFVKSGECGLRQSDAVFAHIKNLPTAMDKVRDITKDGKICAVGVSTRPRNVDGSYMPCFLSGVTLAHGIAASLNVPLYQFSHQCGHIMAAILSSGRYDLLSRPFGAFHISGGTTELLHILSFEDGFQAQLVGGTLDASAGQVIDRVGVFMGLPFPAGAHMEKLALSYNGKVPNRKPTTNGTYSNLSGLENLAQKLYRETNDKGVVCAFMFRYIARMLEELTNAYQNTYGKNPVLFAGGVMSCSFIREYLKSKFNASFAEPALSSDNAVGIAELTRHKFLLEK